MTSKSLCRVQDHAFGLIPTKRYFHDFHISVFYSQTSKSPYLLDFSRTYSFTLDINTTVSTWPELPLLMSPFLGTGQPFFMVFTVSGNISIKIWIHHISHWICLDIILKRRKMRKHIFYEIIEMIYIVKKFMRSSNFLILKRMDRISL